MTTTLASVLRDLYGVEPGEFVAERNRLAKELKAGGDTELATAVKALAKPRLSEHALNRVARDEPKLVSRFVDAAAAAREAQSAAIGGDAGALREATAELRQASAALVDAAVRATGEGQRDDIASLLRDAVSGGTDQLAAGVLGSADIELPTELFAGAPEPPPSAGARAKPAEQPPTKQAPSKQALSKQALSKQAKQATKKQAEAELAAGPRLSVKEQRERKAAHDKLERARRDAGRAVDDIDLAISDLEAEIATRARRLEKLQQQRDDLVGRLERAQSALDDFEAGG